MRDNKSDPDRWTTERAKGTKEAPPEFEADRGTPRAALDELRRYPFFFADEDDDTPTATHADMKRSATAPPIPAPPAEIRPLLTHVPLAEANVGATNRGATAVPVRTTPTPPTPSVPAAAAPASLAARHAAAIARRQAPPPTRVAAPAAPVESSAAPEPEEVVPTPHSPQATPSAQEPWYSRVPTGSSLVAIIVYFLIGGVALIATGLVLGGVGGGLLTIFGLAVASVAAFVAWQELNSTRG